MNNQDQVDIVKDFVSLVILSILLIFVKQRGKMFLTNIKTAAPQTQVSISRQSLCYISISLLSLENEELL